MTINPWFGKSEGSIPSSPAKGVNALGSNWTDQTPQTTTEEDLQARWNGRAPGVDHRCYLCGKKFKLGDYWRFVMGRRTINFKTCKDCDGPDVLERFEKMNDDLAQRYWWALRR